jgi:hypothetical protein
MASSVVNRRGYESTLSAEVVAPGAAVFFEEAAGAVGTRFVPIDRRFREGRPKILYF